MPPPVTFTFRTSALSERLKSLRELFGDQLDLVKVVGFAVRNQVISHFRRKDAGSRNKLGAAPSHFWRDVADSVGSVISTSNEAGAIATIPIRHVAILQKIKGGKIVAKKTKALTIPVSKEAYGKSVKEFKDRSSSSKPLVLLRRDGRVPLLVRFLEDRVEIHYVLVKSVVQAADPTALPPLSEIDRTVEESSSQYYERKIKET